MTAAAPEREAGDSRSSELPARQQRLLPAISWAAFGVFGVWFAARLIPNLALRLQFEDQLIVLRYARNLAEGNGFVYNAGERVMGFTTPLFTVLSSAFVVRRRRSGGGLAERIRHAVHAGHGRPRRQTAGSSRRRARRAPGGRPGHLQSRGRLQLSLRGDGDAPLRPALPAGARPSPERSRHHGRRRGRIAVPDPTRGRPARGHADRPRLAAPPGGTNPSGPGGAGRGAAVAPLRVRLLRRRHAQDAERKRGREHRLAVALSGSGSRGLRRGRRQSAGSLQPLPGADDRRPTAP